MYSREVIELGPATDQDMVDAYLRAELDSPRFAQRLKTLLLSANVTPEELFDPRHAELRHQLLEESRGYRRDEHLFRGFPLDVSWRHATVTQHELSTAFYANVPAWVMLSAGTRRVADGAANLTRSNIVSESRQSINAAIHVLADEIRQQGLFFPPLIVVTDHARPQRIVMLEGHTRATAIVHALVDTTIPVLVGSSATMHQWWVY